MWFRVCSRQSVSHHSESPIYLNIDPVFSLSWLSSYERNKILRWPSNAQLPPLSLFFHLLHMEEPRPEAYVMNVIPLFYFQLSIPSARSWRIWIWWVHMCWFKSHRLRYGQKARDKGENRWRGNCQWRESGKPHSGEESVRKGSFFCHIFSAEFRCWRRELEVKEVFWKAVRMSQKNRFLFRRKCHGIID